MGLPMSRRDHKHEELSERSRRTLLAEYESLPRQADGRVVKGLTSLLARKWSLTPSGLLNMVRHIREGVSLAS